MSNDLITMLKKIDDNTTHELSINGIKVKIRVFFSSGCFTRFLEYAKNNNSPRDILSMTAYYMYEDTTKRLAKDNAKLSEDNFKLATDDELHRFMELVLDNNKDLSEVYNQFSDDTDVFSKFYNTVKKQEQQFNDSLSNTIRNTVSSLKLPNNMKEGVKLKMPDVLRNYEMADYQYEVIMKRIKEFEDELDDEHEVAVQLASFGKDILLKVTEIGYSNPNTIVFYGFVGSEKASLIQHMSMLNFLMLAVKKSEPNRPPNRIGFSDG